MKTGRNDPCPCGNGTKYKNCCLPRHKKDDASVRGIEIDAGDPTARRVNRILQKYRAEIKSALSEPIQRMEKESLSALPPNCLLSEDESVKVLLWWKQRTITEIEKLCATHSKHFWLHLSRLMSVEATEPGAYQDYASTLTLALMKYGVPHIENEYVIVPPSLDLEPWISSEEPYTGETMSTLDAADFGSGSKGTGAKSKAYPNMIPKQVTKEDLIRVYQIGRLAERHCMTLSGLRLIRKGGRLKISNGSFEKVDLPEDLDELVFLHNQRREKYGSLLDYLGSIVDYGTPDTVGGKGGKGFHTIIPGWNIDRKDISFTLPMRRYTGPRVSIRFTAPTFIPNLITLEPFYRKACVFRQAVEAELGFSPEAVTAFLIGLGNLNFARLSQHLGLLYSFCERGYDLMAGREDEEFKQGMEGWLKAAHNELFDEISHEQASQYTQRVLDWLTYKDGDFDSINLDERTGAKLVLGFPHGILIDYTVIPMILQSIFHKLFLKEGMPVSGTIGKSKGSDFEKEVKRYLEASLPDFSPWICGYELRFSSGQSREIDVSFSWGTILFIVECKAHSFSLGARRGEARELEKQIRRLEEALRLADEIAQKLAQEPRGRNFGVPEGVTHIAPIATSPFPEYIPDKSEGYFLNERIPRVCTPREIVEFLQTGDMNSFLTKPFVIPLRK